MICRYLSCSSANALPELSRVPLRAPRGALLCGVKVPTMQKHWLHVKPKATALTARWGGGRRREQPVCKLMNSIRFQRVTSLRSKGEVSAMVFLGLGAQRHCVSAVWGESNRSGPVRTPKSVKIGRGSAGMLGGGMVGRAADMQAWGELRKNHAGHRREPWFTKGAVLRRSRSPHSSEEAGLAKPGGAKGGRKVDALNPDHGKQTKR